MKDFKKYLLFLILALVPGSLYSQDFDEAISKTNQTLQALMEVSGMPGLQVSVSIGNDIVYEGVFGVSDIDSKNPLSNSTQMRIGSVTKLFTATAIAILLQEGKIDLNDDIRKYVPEFPDKGDVITIRQLLTHSSGIRHYTRDETFSLNEKPYNDLVEALSKFDNDSLIFAPGSSTEYSSYGYVLLGAMVEKVSKQSFTSFILNEVIRPSGMTFTEPESKSASNLASFYYPGKDGYTFASGEDNSYKWPAGGYVSSSTDLVQFASALLSNKIVNETVLKDMFSLQNPETDKNNYGIGFRIGKDYKGRTVVHHGGTSQGSRSFLLIYPDEKIAIALNSNVLGAPLFEGEAETIAGYFLNDFTEVKDYEDNRSFTTILNKKEVTPKFRIKNSSGDVKDFSSSDMPLTDVVIDGSYTRIITVSRSGIVNFWLGMGENFWGYDTKVANLQFTN